MFRSKIFFVICVLTAINLTNPISGLKASETSIQTRPSTLQGDFLPILFHNGNILTVDANNSQAEALLIRGNSIVAVGTNADILALKEANTIVVDLQGKTVVPGFIDGHTHFLRNRPPELSLNEAQEIALSFGLTGLSELSADQGYIDDLLAAESNNELRLRVNVFPEYDAWYLENGQRVDTLTWFQDNPPILDPGRRLRIPGVKIFVDGAFDQTRGCLALSEPYPSDFVNTADFQNSCYSDKGDLYFSQEELNNAVLAIQNQGYRVAMHAMGDAAVEMGVNAIESALNGQPNSIYRHQIHHSSVIRPDQIRRYAELDILASVRGYFNTCDIAFYADWYGDERDEWAVNRYGLVSPDIHAFHEGDFIAGDPYSLTSATYINPMMGLYGLVTHQQLREDESSCPPTEWLAHYQISVENALRMMTIEPAYAVSQEDVIGSLEPNKFADLTILSENPLTIDPNSLYKIESLMTMVDGQVEFCREGFEQFCRERDAETQANNPESDADILFYDDFSVNSVDWEEFDIDISYSKIINGKYVIVFTADEYNGWGVQAGTNDWNLAPIFTQPYEFSLEISEVASTNSDYCILLDFDYQQGGTFKRFRFCVDGAWEFSVLQDGNLNIIKEGTVSNGEFMFLDALTHLTKLKITPTNYGFWVDDKLITEVPSQGEINGSVRFGVMRSRPEHTVMRASFDNLVVRKIE